MQPPPPAAPRPRFERESREFNPQDTRFRYHLWVRMRGANGAARWYVYWRRLAVVGATTLVAGWLLSAAAVWGVWRFKRGIDNASYVKLLLPWQWADARRDRGLLLLERGEAAWKAEQYSRGINLLRQGLVDVPDDLPRRRLLALAYADFGRAYLAADILEAKAELAREQDGLYLRLLFELLFELQEDQRALALAKRLLPPAPTERIIDLYIALQAATALHNAGDYDQAEKIIAEWGIYRSAEGQLLLAQADWERGHQALAVLRLERERASFPKSDEMLVRLIRFYRLQGRAEEARAIARERRALDDKSPGPRLDLLYTHHFARDLPAMRAEFESYVAAFGSDAKAMELLAIFALDIGEASLAERVRDLAAEKKLPTENFTLILVQARLAAQDYKGALEVADAALQEKKDGKTQNFGSMLAGLRAVAHFALGDADQGNLHLNAFLGLSRLRANEGVFLARQLLLVGAESAAARTLKNAITQEPYNQPALSELVLMNARVRDLPELRGYLARLLKMRKPSRVVLEEAIAVLDPVADLALIQEANSVLSRIR